MEVSGLKLDKELLQPKQALREVCFVIRNMYDFHKIMRPWGELSGK